MFAYSFFSFLSLFSPSLPLLSLSPSLFSLSLPLSQFLSARTNKRTDDYGGSIENRSRIIFRVIEEIKKQVPADFLLSIKINSADFSVSLPPASHPFIAPFHPSSLRRMQTDIFFGTAGRRNDH